MTKVWILNLFVGLSCLLMGFIVFFKTWYILSSFEFIIGIWNLYYVYKQWKK